MSKITGRFKTINNDDIEVAIYNKTITLPNINIDSTKTVYFGDNPVIITQQNDDTFEHILKTQCKITLVTNRYLGEYLFANNWLDIIVNVWRNNECIFCGAVTPMTFQQNYSKIYEELEVNAVDILSVLKEKRLTDETPYSDLVAQSTIRPFKWYMDQMKLGDKSFVIPNLPDIDFQEAEMHVWIETGYEREVQESGEIVYYGVESNCIMLDEDTAVDTGETRRGEEKTVTWIESEDTAIVDGVPYYKEYAWIVVNGEDVNTGDWRVSSNEGDMPVMENIEDILDGWTRGALPQPFEYYEHFTLSYVYDTGMTSPISDRIGDQIPEYPSLTSYNSYWDLRQGSETDLDIDETTYTAYYKNYGWVTVNDVAQNSYDWVRGNVKAFYVESITEITGWQKAVPAITFQYFETISYYDVYSDGSRILTQTQMGEQIPLKPSTTTNGSYYEFRQGDDDDIATDYTTGYNYYKEYAWVVVNGVAEKTSDWTFGDKVNQFIDYPIYGKMVDGVTTAPSFKFGSYQSTSYTTRTADLFDEDTYEFGFSEIPEYSRPSFEPQSGKLNIEKLFFNVGNNVEQHFGGDYTDCVNLDTLDINCFMVGNLTNAFKNCSSLTKLKINNTSSIITMAESAFEGCTYLPNTIDLSNVNLDRCSYMFKNCTSLETVKLSGFTQMYNDVYDYTSVGLFDGSSIQNVYYYLNNWVFNRMDFFALMYDAIISAPSKPNLIIPEICGNIDYVLTYDTTNSCYQSNYDIIIYNGSVVSSVVCTLDDNTTLTLTPDVSGDYNLYKIPNTNRQHVKNISVSGYEVTIVMPIDKYVWNNTDDKETTFTFNSNIRVLDLSLWCNVPYDCDSLLYGLNNLGIVYLGSADYSNKSHDNMFSGCSSLSNVYTTKYETVLELTNSTGSDYIPTSATVYGYDTYSSYPDSWGVWAYNSSTHRWEIQ